MAGIGDAIRIAVDDSSQGVITIRRRLTWCGEFGSIMRHRALAEDVDMTHRGGEFGHFDEGSRFRTTALPPAGAIALCGALLIWSGLLVPRGAWAQSFPSKPIRFVVAAAPGAGIDTLARMVAQKAASGLGQQVVVENVSGASGFIGAALVAKSAADGYTILAGTDATQSAHLYQKGLNYDPANDFSPITGGGLSVTCMAVNASLPVNTVEQFIDYARKNPGSLSFGSGGGTTSGSFYLAGDYFKKLTNTDLVGIPYKGLADVMTQLLGGRITVAFTTVTTALPQQQSGKVKILAITESKRYAALPDVPTLAEVVPGYVKAATWNGYFAPAGTPAAVVRRLNAEMVTGLHATEMSKLPGINIIGGTPEEFGSFVKEQQDILAKLLKLAGVNPQ